MKTPFLLLFSFSSLLAVAQSKSLPEWAQTAFAKKGLDKKYTITSFKPDQIKADFNGDKEADIAIPVVETSTKKKGILVIHGKTTEHYLLGAGREFGNVGDDFDWMDKWSLYKKKTASETQFDKSSGDILGSKEVKLERPAILIQHAEKGSANAGGLIYWNGKRYTWIHQGS
ncbi:MAG: hypothetical protein ACTHMC_18650 [Pseudobacter sp.]|uniref:hypothetical protein n=1 Tax=Pseudobacter sp. TaxID=2045420 RepID=UPI003F81DA98